MKLVSATTEAIWNAGFLVLWILLCIFYLRSFRKDWRSFLIIGIVISGAGIIANLSGIVFVGPSGHAGPGVIPLP